MGFDCYWFGAILMFGDGCYYDGFDCCLVGVAYVVLCYVCYIVVA